MKFVALPVPEIIGGIQQIWTVLAFLAMPTLPFYQDYKWAFVRMDPKNVPAKFEVLASSVPGIIVIGVLGGGCEPPILGKRRP